jgi:glycosyltransferase involved in cell wall biosynthesis
VTYVGIDLEQFLRDPYGSGIQRVLQYLAREWPQDLASADFVVPVGDQFALLTPTQAGEVLSIPFAPREPGTDLREAVAAAIAECGAIRVKPGDLVAIYDTWLLPEVSYLPSVLDRFSLMSRCMPTAMIGYDTLPMSEPANYRFRPGTAGQVSEYFRLLAATDSVVCISDYAREAILGRLRREPSLPITVAHPGGDHLDVRAGQPPERTSFCRLGTMEARKRPVEILRAFQDAVAAGAQADLVFIGGRSASDEAINAAVSAAAESDLPVTWIVGASDAEVRDLVNTASVFLSVGVEGYGIPVLEAIQQGTPVLYDGIQPAGDVMAGHGARRVPAMEHADLVRLFTTYAEPGAARSLAAEVDPSAVPTWADFARGVAEACRPS